MNKIGINYLKVNGSELSVKGNVTVNMGKPQREEVVGADKLHGVTEKPTVPFFEFEITDSAELSLDWLADVEDATIVCGLKNGKLYSLSKGICTNPDGLQLNTEEGNISLKFIGEKMTELQ